MSRPGFRHLSPGPGAEPIPSDDPLAAAAFLELRRAGLSPDKSNVVLNATLERLNAAVSATGQPMSLDDAGAVLREQLAAEGINDDQAEALTREVRQVVTASHASAADILSPENVKAIEDTLADAVADGRLSEDGLVALVGNATDAEGVRYAGQVAQYLAGRGPAPAPHPDAPDFHPEEIRSAQASDDHGDDRDTSADDGALQGAGGNHQQHQHQEDDAMSADDMPTEDTDEQKAAKAAAYARVNDPRYHERGPAGDLFRAETDVAFQEAFGTEDAGETGRSDPGYGI